MGRCGWLDRRMKLSKALQETYVSQGLALGVLAAGREALPARKLDFELALRGAWRGFPYASRFPQFDPSARDPWGPIVSRSERRRSVPLAAWGQVGGELHPYSDMHGWTVEECGEHIEGASGVPWSAWCELAHDFLARFDGVGEKSPRTPG